jgi:hypothetical protein
MLRQVVFILKSENDDHIKKTMQNIAKSNISFEDSYSGELLRGNDLVEFSADD